MQQRPWLITPPGTSENVVRTDVDGDKGHLTRMIIQKGFGVSQLAARGVLLAVAAVQHGVRRLTSATEILGLRSGDESWT